jgi:hypothetical protein
MSLRKIVCISSSLLVLAVLAAGPASAERMCYPYPDGGPGGYNKLTHSCNPMHMYELPVAAEHGRKVINPQTGGTHGTANTTTSDKVGPAIPK